MLIDEVTIQISAGKGGDGLVHFLRTRTQPKGGPDGGNGGRGGNVLMTAVSDIGALHQFRFQKSFKANPGSPGRHRKMSGPNSQDLILKIPLGTVVTFPDGKKLDFLTVGQTETIAKGGKGGWGNHHFRGPQNRQPRQFLPGLPGESYYLHLELKLIAQIGLVGLPNAGKSSLLNALTNASAQVANYPFTTLEPNLGVLPNNAIIADIPGLIEGASSGRGLGNRFLRHAERTRILVHCLALDAEDLLQSYSQIRSELLKFSSSFAKRKEIIVLTKADLSTPAKIAKTKKILTQKTNLKSQDIYVTSIHQKASLKALSQLLCRLSD